jgi:hypothetical protein
MPIKPIMGGFELTARRHADRFDVEVPDGKFWLSFFDTFGVTDFRCLSCPLSSGRRIWKAKPPLSYKA